MMRRQVQQRVWTGIILVLTLVPGLLSAGAGEAATYYVATSGSSGCSTNINAPSDNVQNSLNCLSPGDTLYFRRGTYNIGTSLNNPPSGTSSARITIAGYPQDGPLAVRLNVGSSGSNGITISGPRYLTFDNLVIDASAAEAAGFKVTGSAGYIRLQNSEVRNAGTQGILTTDSTGGNEFLNVKVHDNGRNTQFDHGLYISSSDNVVEGCEIYNNANFGVHVYGEGTSIDRNIVRKNRIYGNGSAMVIGAGDNNMAYNNLVYSNGTGIQIRNGGTGNKVYNNSIYNNRGGDSGGSCILNVNDGTIIRNNICYQNQTNAINGDGSATTSNNLFENPSFVNASAADFHLQAGSAASDTGFDLSSVITTDYAGTARPQGSGFDIGAYEFGGGSLPAPRNLHITTTK